MDDGLGCLPLDDGAYPPPTHCRHTHQRYSEFGCCWYPTRARKHPVALPPRCNKPTLHLNAFRREPAITEFDWPFTPSPRSSPGFQPRWVRSSTRSYPRFNLPRARSSRFGSRTRDSKTPCSDSPSLRLPHDGLASPRITDSQTHFSIGTPSPRKEAPTDRRRTVSGTLSLPSRGAFHLSLTVLVRYRSDRYA